ncbi:Fur family transcriptional regulator [Dinghuibacter silviterrae]|uniref:Fur family ferric uptake transcriptional regulator n=1 Tax=Dinghuibacter silviterrae TaxID=1539049 RepID=A0A4R8DR68_9BACT|nr:Fur family transcriptional regulator [Dinghuibacter silviterrae]TDW99620.1 Fur family ferric uptake transcriptional regulator [Dinghuibacter silviterrae]
MMSSSAKDARALLKKHALSVTEGRLRILELFLRAGGALSHADVEKADTTFDRVTVYRTLQSFVEKGLLHTIPTSENNVRYALCNDACTTHRHQDDHVHFVCDVCRKTVCLDHVAVPALLLPAGFVSEQVQVVVHGVCDLCARPR